MDTSKIMLEPIIDVEWSSEEKSVATTSMPHPGEREFWFILGAAGCFH